jgi:aspartate-semialdehyde dehydrogenase
VLARSLADAPVVSARWIRVPAFVGQVSALAISWEERAVDPAEAALLLGKAPGVDLWSAEDEGPNLRAVAGREASAMEEVPGSMLDDVATANQYREAVERLKAEMGEEAFSQGWEEGRAMSVEEAVAYALQEPFHT